MHAEESLDVWNGDRGAAVFGDRLHLRPQEVGDDVVLGLGLNRCWGAVWPHPDFGIWPKSSEKKRKKGLTSSCAAL